MGTDSPKPAMAGPANFGKFLLDYTKEQTLKELGVAVSYKPTTTSSLDLANRLSKPVAIPTARTEIGSPFLRAYAPDLANSGIPRADFLLFLDRLNAIWKLNDSIQALGMIGGAVGLVPEPTAQIVSASLEYGSEIAVEVIAEARSEMWVRQCNAEMFGPLGLHARIVKLNELAEAAGIPVLDETKVSKGKIVVGKDAQILAPLDQFCDVKSMNTQARRMLALAPWTAELEIEEEQPVLEPGSDGEIPPPPGRMKQMMKKADDLERKINDVSMNRKRRKLLEKYEEDQRKAGEKYEKRLQELDEKERKLETKKASSSSSSMAEEKASLGRKRDKALKEHTKKLLEIETDRRKHDKEEKEMRKIKFLMITNVGEGKQPGEKKERPAELE